MHKTKHENSSLQKHKEKALNDQQASRQQLSVGLIWNSHDVIMTLGSFPHSTCEFTVINTCKLQLLSALLHHSHVCIIVGSSMYVEISAVMVPFL